MKCNRFTAYFVNIVTTNSYRKAKNICQCINFQRPSEILYIQVQMKLVNILSTNYHAIGFFRNLPTIHRTSGIFAEKMCLCPVPSIKNYENFAIQTVLLLNLYKKFIPILVANKMSAMW